MSPSPHTLLPAPSPRGTVPRAPEPLVVRRPRVGRLRTTVAAGGLAVLLGSTLVAAPAHAAAGVTSAAAHRHAVARTGGQP